MSGTEIGRHRWSRSIRGLSPPRVLGVSSFIVASPSVEVKPPTDRLNQRSHRSARDFALSVFSEGAPGALESSRRIPVRPNLSALIFVTATPADQGPVSRSLKRRTNTTRRGRGAWWWTSPVVISDAYCWAAILRHVPQPAVLSTPGASVGPGCHFAHPDPSRRSVMIKCNFPSNA
jgi:hypothetical protein